MGMDIAERNAPENRAVDLEGSKPRLANTPQTLGNDFHAEFIMELVVPAIGILSINQFMPMGLHESPAS